MISGYIRVGACRFGSVSLSNLAVTSSSTNTSLISTTYIIMGHTELTSKADYDAALAQTGKYVLIYAYEGEVHPKAEE
jgi:hypothetical protein